MSVKGALRERCLAALERCKRAPARPWRHCCEGHNPKCERMVWSDADQETPVCHAWDSEDGPGTLKGKESAAFIAEARADVEDFAEALLRVQGPEMLTALEAWWRRYVPNAGENPYSDEASAALLDVIVRIAEGPGPAASAPQEAQHLTGETKKQP